MRIISWNVNGLRAVMGKGFVEWLNSSGADVVGLQEVRATTEQLAKEIAMQSGSAMSETRRPATMSPESVGGPAST